MSKGDEIERFTVVSKSQSETVQKIQIIQQGIHVKHRLLHFSATVCVELPYEFILIKIPVRSSSHSL